MCMYHLALYSGRSGKKYVNLLLRFPIQNMCVWGRGGGGGLVCTMHLRAQVMFYKEGKSSKF